MIRATLALVLAYIASAQAMPWPEVSEAEFHIGISPSDQRIGFSFPVKGKDGRLLYQFSCDGGSASYLNSISTDVVTYVPDMMCLLNEGPSKSEASLLAEGTEPPWHTRGQYRWSDLVAACGSYPEYGRFRHFLVRGMRVTLEATNFQMSEGRIVHFMLNVTVANDQTAASSRSAPPGYLQPERDCTTIKRGTGPAYCRNVAGSYEPCRTQ